MPANLPPEYYEAERGYRGAKTPQEKIEVLERMLSLMPKHKGTDRLRAELRTRMARLNEELERRPLGGRRGSAYQIKKEGAGQAVLVGLPNVGKSQLLASLTGASPKIADYPFTTLSPLPGMMEFENIQIQLVDLPPLTYHEAHRWLREALRKADLLLLLADLKEDPVPQIETVFAELARIRIRPVGKEPEDRFEGENLLKKALIVGNKCDLAPGEDLSVLRAKYADFPLATVSAKEGQGLEDLKRAIFEALDIIRVYTKAPGKEPDLTQPVILPRGSTVEDAAEAIHKDLRRDLKYAQVWGSGKFDGQRVPKQYPLQDGDIVELHA